jgi:hypothetical protein
VEAPAGSPVKDIVDDQPGTARIGAAAANKTAFEFFSTPRKKTKVSVVSLRWEMYSRMKRRLQIVVA